MDSDTVRLAQLLRGFAINQIIASATRLDIPSLIAQRPRDPDELARLTGIPEERLGMVLAVLAELGIARRDDDGRFTATGMTGLLTREHGGLYGQALMSADLYYRLWAELDHCLQTGESACDKALGTSFWGYLDAHPEVAEHFARTMGTGSNLAADPVLGAYDFPDTGRIVDVGAGDGSFTAAVLRRRPGLAATLLERPAQIPHLEQTLVACGVRERCEVVCGDMFDAVPDGGDLYLFKGVFHNWPDAALLPLLDRLHAQLAGGARVLVIERALPERVPDLTMNAAINTLTMTILFGTTDRTADGYRRLLERSRFTTRVWHVAQARLDLIEGVKNQEAT